MAISGTPSTLPRRFWQWAGERGSATLLRQKQLGVWRPCSWQQATEAVGDIAAGLVDLGIMPGDAVSILANTSKDWVFADLGAQTAGAIVGGLHVSDPASEVQTLCRDIGARVLFVENEEQLDKLLEARLPALEHIVVFHMEGLRGLADRRISSLDDLQRRGAQLRATDPGLIERRLESRSGDDVATVVYTSGTTGRAKGVLLSHANILAACEALRTALFGEASGGGERVLFLPLSHVMERIGGEYLNLMLGAVLNFVENPETVFENVREVQPDVFMAVPRVWERLHSTLAIALHEATPLQRWAYARAIAVGGRVAAATERGERPSAGLGLLCGLARGLVLNNLRRMMGLDRVRFGITGAAPISPELIRWFRAMGVELRELWGLSEVSGGATVTGFGQRPGSVGRALPSLELRLSDEGEVLLRGPTVCMGYHGEAVGAAVTPDGWLRTGDLGRLDDAGDLHITDRMEDIIVTGAGARVAPSAWENRLKFSPYISDAVLVGLGRPHLSCLVLIDQENVEQWAQDRQLVFSDFRSLCASDEVIGLIAEEIEQVNRSAPGDGRIEAFRLIDEPAGADEKALTPTMKLKRRHVLDKYAVLVDELYAARAA